MTYHFLTVRDYEGRDVAVRADLIEYISHPSGRPNDHGHISLTTGRVISLGWDGETRRIEKDLAALEPL